MRQHSLGKATSILTATTFAALSFIAAPHASAGGISCGEVAYPNSRQVGTLTVNTGGPTCTDARAVLDDHFADVLADDGIPRLPASSPLQRYACVTDFSMAGGMRGLTECRYIIGEGNDADASMEIVVLPK